MNVDLFQTQSVWILLVLISASVKMVFHDQPHQGHVKVVLTVLLIMKFKKLENLQINIKFSEFIRVILTFGNGTNTYSVKKTWHSRTNYFLVYEQITNTFVLIKQLLLHVFIFYSIFKCIFLKLLLIVRHYSNQFVVNNMIIFLISLIYFKWHRT